MNQEPYTFHGKTYASFQEFTNEVINTPLPDTSEIERKMEAQYLQRLQDFRRFWPLCPELSRDDAEAIWHKERKKHNLE